MDWHLTPAKLKTTTTTTAQESEPLFQNEMLQESNKRPTMALTDSHFKIPYYPFNLCHLITHTNLTS